MSANNEQNSNILKKLTGKNPNDFEFAASHIINNTDIQTFSALVEQSDFLFDFIKNNVNQRLLKACNEKNYRNLLKFLKIYSPDYENFIVSTLAKYADEDLTDEMLELLENGTDEEKAYCAKYFSQINDTLAIDLLREYSYSDFEALAFNSALALSEMKDDFSYNLAIGKLNSDDEFEKLSAVSFLIAYNDKKAVGEIFKTMKTSSMPENIASEIPYMQSLMELLDSDFKNDSILAINHIINGLGEIVSLGQIFDFQLFEVLDKLIGLQNQEKDSKIAVVLLGAKAKLDQLTENDEYIFDEDKNTKNEVVEIKKLLNAQAKEFWDNQENSFIEELDENSEFIYSALELIQEIGITGSLDKLKILLQSNNQTIILKTVEVIKNLNKLDEIDMKTVLEKITDENIKQIITSYFA